MNALLPLSWLYAAGAGLDRRRRSVPKARAGERPRVVSIGNLETGGNGKTPLALWWLERAAGAGAQVAYVSRGYGGAADSPRVVTCVLPGGIAPARPAGMRLLSRGHGELAREIGDEGALVVERVPGAMALFCADKCRAVAAAADLGADTVVLDDAFQSWAVARHADIVLLDAERPLDGGHLVPAGTLREKASALGRADAVVFNGASTPAMVQCAHDQVAPWIGHGVPVAGMVRTLTLVAAGGGAGDAPARLVAVSAIARPDGFARALARAGVDVAAHVVFRDHHRYDARDAARVSERARREGAGLVTTEKDWVKLRDLDVEGRVWVARLDVSLIGDPLPL